ncbi:DUF2147 domain-containing protein [Flaviaesturariibacter amylovorans]|uniref:DUF2147 domain-containing protein n=1 Tax=Flaviaesturariibacter amylovorans TaxID=1084520 RepID=A0ABP8HEW8_9BACT
MKKLIFFLVLLLSIGNVFGQDKGDAIVGEWLSSSKEGKIQIYRQGNKYFGKISWSKNPGNLDTKNPDEKLRSRTIVGSVILKDFEFDGDNEWEDGTIYDPKSGKTYSCNMELKNANQLKIRGYIGISLIGRTEVWDRVK